MERVVIIDTNILLLPGVMGLDLFGEIERIAPASRPAVVSETIEELKRLAEGNGKDANAASLALAVLKKKDILILPDRQGHTDDSIIAYAEETGCMVATQDKDLRKRVRDCGCKAIALRTKNHLEIL